MGELRDQIAGLNREEIGRRLHNQVVDLYPFFRSITGEGVRQTLRRIAQEIPLQLHEVPSGTQVLDWTVPREWSIRDAYIKNEAGDRIVDLDDLNLHVVNYSMPVNATMSLAELQPHLHSLPDRPDAVPYRTSYYDETWGFCISHDQRLSLKEGTYKVRIDSSLSDGSLTYGECILPGETADEVLISTHVCHPSLANDNLSGIVVATGLAQLMASVKRRYTYRFIFVPATIGAITWLARNEATAGNVKHGFVLAGVGDGGSLTYKRSRRASAEIDQAFEYVLNASGEPHSIIDFEPYGYDERQYCSPGFDLPVGSLSRTPYASYPEYHTSDDNPDFVLPASLFDSLLKCLEVLEVVEGNNYYVNLQPRGEPQLGRRGLYKSIGGMSDEHTAQQALLWVLSGSDGRQSLLDIARRAGIQFPLIENAARQLQAAGLVSTSLDGS